MAKNWNLIYEADISKLDEKELKNLIQEIKDYRINETNCPSLSAGECNTLLALVHSEQNSRSSSKLAKTAIWISVASFVVSVVLSLISQFSGGA